MATKADIRRALARSRRPYFKAGMPFVLLWAEKAGCTSWLKWFLFQTGELEEALALDPWIHTFERRVMYKREKFVEVVATAIADGVPVIRMARCPFQRTVSSFLTLSERPANWRTEVLREIRGHAFGAEDVPYGLSFRHYLDWLETVELDRLNGHLGPQTTLLESMVDVRMLSLSSFESEVRQLEAEFGLPAADLGGLTRSHHHTERQQELSGAWVEDLQIPCPRAERYPLPPTDQFLSERARERIGRIFAEDVARLAGIA